MSMRPKTAGLAAFSIAVALLAAPLTAEAQQAGARKARLEHTAAPELWPRT